MCGGVIMPRGLRNGWTRKKNGCVNNQNNNLLREIDMPKPNKKQIEANLRNKLASQYKEKSEQLKSEKSALEIKYNKLWSESCEIKRERDELKEKVTQLEDWNRRLQEFMDMNEEERTAYVENLKKTKELYEAIKRFGFYGKMMGTLFA
jgi:chromosome segregation ATPase